ncbi:MAG: DUF4105 domain-containing protein [Treponema sp.]|jgi:hypothetical protein|nr:DUF4105 domain-containing protein [Treponema sp.]
MNKKTAFLVLLLFFMISSVIFAEGENLTLKIAVMGPGDELYFWWGHIALVIEDSNAGTSRFYDYGLFSFENENFFYNFAFGRLLYSCGVSSTNRNIAGYVGTNRDVVFYTLNIPPENRKKVHDFAAFNVLPENRNYFYHHFKDNCSTRIRDIIDLATDGQFKEQFGNAPGRYTLRQHVRRHTWFMPPADWALNFWMGQVIDTPITIWEEMFLPSEVASRIEDFWYTSANGEKQKLVTAVETVNKAKDRPIVLDVPRKQWPRELAFSVVLSVIFAFFFNLQLKKKSYRKGRILSGLSMSLTGLVFGVASLLLYFMALFTNHDYTFQNYNMLFGTPLLLAAVPLGIFYAFAKKIDRQTLSKASIRSFYKLAKKAKSQIFHEALLRLIWLITALGIIISMLIKLLPAFYQQNLTDQMLILPFALLFAFQPVGLREVLNRFFPNLIQGI